MLRRITIVIDDLKIECLILRQKLNTVFCESLSDAVSEANRVFSPLFSDS